LNLLTRSLVRHAHAIAREVGARAVLLSADVVEEDKDLADLIKDVDFRSILVSRRIDFQAPEGWGDLCAVARVPNLPMTRAGLVKVATLVAVVEGLVKGGDRIVWLTGLGGSGTIDTVLVLDIGTEAELFSVNTADPLPCDVKPEVFERLLSLAGQLAMEGREGRPVGTLFVLGDSETVLQHSHQLVMNPFHGYPEADRNILDTRLEETIKEFSAIDGAFVVRGDGTLLCAGRYLVPKGTLAVPLAQGLGARHEAAAGITISTSAISLSISQSTGTVSLFKQGRMLTDIQKPRSGGADEI
jgi:diadenylate cyclase